MIPVVIPCMITMLQTFIYTGTVWCHVWKNMWINPLIGFKPTIWDISNFIVLRVLWSTVNICRTVSTTFLPLPSAVILVWMPLGYSPFLLRFLPDSKVHGANMGPPGSCRPQMGPMMAPRTLLSGLPRIQIVWWSNNSRNLLKYIHWCHFSNALT